MLAALTASTSLAAMLQRCAEAIVDRLDGAFARVWTLEPQENVLVLRASAGMYVHLDGAHSRIPLGKFKIGRIASLRQAHLTNDVLNDEQISDPGWARVEGMVAFAGYPLTVEGRLVGVLGMFARRRLSDQTLEALAAVADSIALGIERLRTEAKLRDENRVLETLNHLGKVIGSNLELNTVVQTVTDRATQLTGAQFGAFFYNVEDENGESYLLYTLSGASYEAFRDFPLPRNTSLFGPTFRGEGTVRIDDVLADSRYGRNPPYNGTPPGHLPVRSYLAVPVIGKDRRVLGGLFFAHETPCVFTDRNEQVVEGIAGYAALAIENASLFEREHRAALALQHRLLPGRLPEPRSITLAARYVPGSRRADVGGDWYDAVVAADGRLVISIGDVVGHGLHAAGVMGQIRTAARAYALAGMELEELVAHLDLFMTETDEDDFATALFICFDPRNGDLTALSAGHPPPLVIGPGGEAPAYMSMEPVPPLGTGLIDSARAGRQKAHARVDAGSTVLLYTDGLVESRDEPIQAGFDRLLESCTAGGDLHPDDLCTQLVKQLPGSAGDDVAVLAFRYFGPAPY